jgi:methyltransferase (TIGR00027 family)
MASREPLTGVGRTALGMARVRAGESRRPDRLFDDPYAEAFVAAVPGAFAGEEERAAAGELARIGSMLAFHGILRTRFFDDYLLAAAAAGCRQVVLLAAGLDTRAFRLAWPRGTRLFELDLPEVLDFKEPVLTREGAVPRCERVVLPADLREDWPAALTGAGFRPGERSAWLVEGLLIYLSAAEAAGLLSAVGELAADGSELAFERGSPATTRLLDQARQLPSMDQLTTLWKGGLGVDAPGWLASHGWRTRTHDHADLAASYGRPVPGRPGGGFVTAIRRRQRLRG